MVRSFQELPDWSFDADEVSAGVYRAFGRDRAGRNVEASGLDPEALIEKSTRRAMGTVTSCMGTSWPDHPHLPFGDQKRFWRDPVKRAVGFIHWLGVIWCLSAHRG